MGSTLLEHLRVFFLEDRACAVCGEGLISDAIEHSLMQLINEVLMGSFTAVPSDQGSPIFAIVERMLS